MYMWKQVSCMLSTLTLYIPVNDAIEKTKGPPHKDEKGRGAMPRLHVAEFYTNSRGHTRV